MVAVTDSVVGAQALPAMAYLSDASRAKLRWPPNDTGIRVNVSLYPTTADDAQHALSLPHALVLGLECSGSSPEGAPALSLSHLPIGHHRPHCRAAPRGASPGRHPEHLSDGFRAELRRAV
ncbi:hypothetical protein BT67DRAFT_443527 [Trichocladium antarcticum]|uniref:Uncharacterized protein n=1 Tax=Trichocladium antarcticum TaxID=1450529 RepID=A0AAN6ZBD4_9PEZI|nr:hypothetical protein BT67DRAFT_443527 [Trichocladium antarcticum]